jgi:hypothetical protein
MAKIAYLVLTHGLPWQTIDFLWSVWREEDAYFVHVDRKSPAIASAAFGAMAAAWPNIHVVPSLVCTWGGFTLVEAALRCLMKALAADPSWSHAVLVSGTHLPLRSAACLAAILEPERSYLTFHGIDLDLATLNPPNFWSGIAQRLTYEYQEVPGIGDMRGPAKSPPRDITFYWGSQWWILSRPAAELVCASRQNPLSEYFRTSAIPDESYFQTVLLNSPLREQVTHRQIVWQKWSENGRPLYLSGDDIQSALSSDQLFARKADEATIRNETGVVAKTIAGLDHVSWVKSVTTAFANFLPPSMFAIIGEEYRRDGGSRLVTGLRENEIATQALLNDASRMIRRSSPDYGLRVQISSGVFAVNQATLTCRFPLSRTQADYLLILRFCNLEIAWIGLYLRATDLDKASSDLQDFPDRHVIDFSFPQTGGFYLQHELLEYGLRRKGVVSLDRPDVAANLEAVTREYLEILSKIPGMVKRAASAYSERLREPRTGQADARTAQHAILYRARSVSPVVQREVKRLVSDLPDFKIFIVCYQPDFESSLHSKPGEIYCYGQRDLHSLPYPEKLSDVDWADPMSPPRPEATNTKFFRELRMGHHDLPTMRFFLDHPDFDRYWMIEDDVRCSGPWTEIFAELARSRADLLMAVVQDHSEAPGWHWWDTLVTGKDTLPLTRRIKGFLPFCGLSAAFLQAVDLKYRHGWGGHYEVTWPNIALVSDLSIEDIGGEGAYTPSERRGRFYTCTSGNKDLFPGTFVYRPAFFDMGVSEFGAQMAPQSTLWHPVKS